MENGGTIERAFDLARSGTCQTVKDIVVQLKREGYSSVEPHLEGPQIKKQLTALIRLASQTDANCL